MAMCGNISLEAAVPQRNNLPLETIRREVDWAWFAGIIDGEGNFAINDTVKSKNGKTYIRPKIRVTNTDARMIRRISELYVAENIVFFTTIHAQKPVEGRSRKTKMNIEVASQGSCRKVLERIIPHLCNKRGTAEAMLEIIKFAEVQPKGRNSLDVRYTETPEFKALMARYDEERRWYIDPSETTRRARSVVGWPGA